MPAYLIQLRNPDGSVCHSEWGHGNDPQFGVYSLALIVHAADQREAVEIAWNRTAASVRETLANPGESANGRQYLSAVRCQIIGSAE